MSTLADLSTRLELSLLAMDRIEVERIFKQALTVMPPIKAAGEVISLALENIGAGWENGHVSLSQVYLSGKICEEVVNRILPADAAERKRQPKMAIAVLEDMHVLGKRIVYSALRASGFELIDFGSGIKVDELYKLIIENNIEIILISVLMLPSALKIKELSERLKNNRIKIVVGGAPFRFDKQLYKEVGAVAVGYSASDAIKIIEELAMEF